MLTPYLVVNMIVLPMTDGWPLRSGAKRLLVLSVTGFTAASFFCGLAPALPFVFLLRIIKCACGGGLPFFL